jgi:hypothetical protein
MRELAAGDEKTLARIDKLAGREQQRFDTKIQKLETRKTSVSEGKADGEGADKDKEEDEDKEE